MSLKEVLIKCILTYIGTIVVCTILSIIIGTLFGMNVLTVITVLVVICIMSFGIYII